jgi:hypothetical protein
LHVETYISENQHDQATIDKINKAREEWIKEVDECELSNLAELEKREDRDLELEEDNLLKRFCFIFEYPGDVLQTQCFTWRFVSTDTFISPRQIACFQLMVSCLGFECGKYHSLFKFPYRFGGLEILFKLTTNKNVCYCF